MTSSPHEDAKDWVGAPFLGKGRRVHRAAQGTARSGGFGFSEEITSPRRRGESWGGARSRWRSWSQLGGATFALALVSACTDSEPRVARVPPPSESREAEALIEVSADELFDRIRARDADFVVLNVWSTWCGPCREEFPYVQSVTRSFQKRGVSLMFVSTDFDSERDEAVRFLREQNADLPSYIKVGPDDAFINAVHPEWNGALPATVIFDRNGDRVKSWMGKVKEEELRTSLQELVEAKST